MRACPYPPYAGDSGDTRAKRRFGAALLISALAHALLSTGITPGSAGRSPVGPAAAPPPIAVRLEIPEAELPVTTPVARVAPLREPAPLRRGREAITAHPTEIPSAPPAHPAGPAANPDPTYYPARQLDVYPALAGTLEVRYPGAADAKGRVLLLVLIDAAGLVDDVKVVESEAPEYLEDDARRALNAARFKPALRRGLPVKSRLLVEIEYSAQERTQ